MKIKELLTEISAGERLRLKKMAVQQKRNQEIEQQKLAAGREKQMLAKRAEKKKSLLSKTTSSANGKRGKSEQPKGIFDDPRFEKYKIDTSIDTDFEGGYYLYFHPEIGTMHAYWGKNISSYEDAVMLNQHKEMGSKFNKKAFEDLLNMLVLKTGVRDQPGYVSIVIPRKLLTHPYIQSVYEFVLREYPQDEPTMNSSIYWELV
jgi:hypothetical protein